MRAINLLPPEALEGVKRRRMMFLLLLAGLVYIFLLGVVTVAWQGRVNDAQKDLEAQQEVNNGLRAELATLQDASDLQATYDDNVALVSAVLAGDLSWGRVLNDLGRMIPDRVWLTAFRGNIETSETALGLGTIQVSGTGFDFTDVAAWLRALDSDRFPSVAGTWVSSVQSSAIGVAEVVTFDSQASLTDLARSSRLAERIPEIAP